MVYIGTYYEVHDVIKYIASVNYSINSGHITNYVTCASGCFCEKAQVYRHLLT